MSSFCSRSTGSDVNVLICGVPEVVHIGDLLHTQPAELTGTHSAVHAVTAAVIGLHDVGTAARARFDLLCIFSNRVSVLGVTTQSQIFIWHQEIENREKFCCCAEGGS